MTAALKAGCVYFAAVFAAGFVLGAFRVVWLAPRLGALGAVLVELPLMLALSWLACGRAVRLFHVAPAVGLRLLTGLSAFALLIAAEFALAVYGFGGDASTFVAGYATAEGLAGLGGQVVFAALPMIRRRTV